MHTSRFVPLWCGTLALLAATTALALAGCASSATSSTTSKQQQVGATSGAKVSIMVGGLSKQIYLPFMLAQAVGAGLAVMADRSFSVRKAE